MLGGVSAECFGKGPVIEYIPVEVKKYAIFEMCFVKEGPGGPKKSIVVSTMATVGPAAKKLHITIAKQTMTA